MNRISIRGNELRYHMSLDDRFGKILYPDGQSSLKMRRKDVHGMFSSHERLITRMRGLSDLVSILQAKDILDYNQIKLERLFISCFFAQRSDRRFSADQSFDLAIMARILNTARIPHIEVLHPHSDVLCAVVKNARPVMPTPMYKHVIEAAAAASQVQPGRRPVLVSPDAGAAKNVTAIAEHYGLPHITCSKVRSGEKGSISTRVHAEQKDVDDANCIIIDDYVDGGATFIGVASALKELGAARVELCVTHGLFSAGVHKLLEVIDHIHVTDSIPEAYAYENIPNLTLYTLFQ